MDLGNIIAFVSSVNADPTTAPDMVEEETTKTVVSRQAASTPIHETKRFENMPARPSFDKLDAKSFLLAVRKAKTRDENIAAIVAYTGQEWATVAANFGTQDQEARAQAAREIRGFQATGPSREEQRAANRSAAGYVKGMPAPSSRLLLNLQARERAFTDALIASKTDEERKANRKALDAVQKAIDGLVG